MANQRVSVSNCGGVSDFEVAALAGICSSKITLDPTVGYKQGWPGPFALTTGVDPTPAQVGHPAGESHDSGYMYWHPVDLCLKAYDATNDTFVTIASVTGTLSLNGAYGNGGTVTVSGAAVTFNGTHGSNNVFAITNATGTGHCLAISNSGTGDDVYGTSGTWYVTKLGAGHFATLGSGAQTITVSSTAVGITFTDSGTGNTITATSWSVTKAGAASFVSIAATSGGAAIAGGLVVSTGGIGITAGGLTVTAGGAAITGNSTITGNLNVTGSFTYGGTLTASTFSTGSITLTDAGATPSTNAYLFYNDTSGYAVWNVKTAKTINLQVNATDEYVFSATLADFKGNDVKCGYVDLANTTVPAGTECYIARDNAGDTTINALTGKTINLAVAGTDIVTLSATTMAFGACAQTLSTGTITFSGAGYIDLGASGLIKAGTNPALAGIVCVPNNTYGVSSRNAANNANIDLIKADGSNYIAFGASLAAHTVAGTLTLGAQQLSFSTGNVTFSGAGYVAINANPADAGAIRLGNTGAMLWRNAANSGNFGINLDASNNLAHTCPIQMGASIVYGDTASGGNLQLSSTTNATKGRVYIATGEVGLYIGAVTARGTTEPTNAISLFNGTAPVGTLSNGATFYVTAGEMRVMDAAGNSTVLSPHTEDGDYIINSFSAAKGKTFRVHLEKLCAALVAKNSNLSEFIEWLDGDAEVNG
jgi:hypothetical protein